MSQGFNNFANSVYQNMLRTTAPKPLDFLVNQLYRGVERGSVQPKIKPQVIKNPTPSLSAQLGKNIGETSRALSTSAKTTGKFAGKAAPVVGAGISVGDAIRSAQLASELENINKAQPGRIPQEAIDYYRNKAKTIGTMTGLGAGTGAVLGSGAFSIPGALVGAGAGGAIGDIGYGLWNWNNPYKEYRMTPEDRQILENYLNGIQSDNSNVSPTGVPKDNLQGDGNNFTVIDDASLGDLNAINRAVGIKGGNGVTQQVKPTAQQLTQAVATIQTPEQQIQNAQIVNDYISKLQQIQQPYINALQNYYNNYDKYLNDYHRKRDFYTGLAGWSGNNLWADIGKDYNTLANEANRVNVMKQLQDAQAGDINAINEVMGNLALAKEMNLPAEAAFANKNLLTALTQNRRQLTDWEKAQLMADVRRYGYDSALNRALAVQDLRNRGMVDVANINAQAYGYGGGYPGVAPGLTQQGTPQPLINQTSKQQVVDPRQQFFQ